MVSVRKERRLIARRWKKPCSLLHCNRHRSREEGLPGSVCHLCIAPDPSLCRGDSRTEFGFSPWHKICWSPKAGVFPTTVQASTRQLREAGPCALPGGVGNVVARGGVVYCRDQVPGCGSHVHTDVSKRAFAKDQRETRARQCWFGVQDEIVSVDALA